YKMLQEVKADEENAAQRSLKQDRPDRRLALQPAGEFEILRHEHDFGKDKRIEERETMREETEALLARYDRFTQDKQVQKNPEVDKQDREMPKFFDQSFFDRTAAGGL